VLAALTILVAAAVVVLMAAPAADAAPKRVSSYMGSAGTGGGQFAVGAANGPQGIAVNDTGAGAAEVGDFYVADRASNRIQQFDSDGNFTRAFGEDVVGINEQQRITVTATAGTYRLCRDVALTECTGNVAFNATGVQVATALAAPAPLFGTGNVAGAGTATQPKVITFQGALAGTDVDELIADTTDLTGTIEIETLTEGAGGSSAGFEVCTDPALCKAGIATAKTGGAMSQPQSVAVDQVDGSVYVLDGGNLRVQKFTAAGEFVWAVGQNVLTGAPATGTVTCAVAANCKIGTTGAQGGAFATTFTGQVAVDPSTRNVYVTDPGNRRVQQFTAAGAFVRAFGFDVDSINLSTDLEVCTVASECKAALTATPANAVDGRFTTNQPTRLAVDSSSSVYTVEQNQLYRVQKFTPFGGGLVRTFFAPLTLNGVDIFPNVVGPTDVAIDPATQNVLVVKAFIAAATSPCPSGAPSAAERRILELDSGGSLLDTHMACAGINSVNGIAVRRSDAPDPAGGSIHVSSTIGHRVYILDEDGAAAATATVGETTAITGHAATLNGEIAPNNEPGLDLSLDWRFEYSKNGAFWAPAPVPNATIPVGATGEVDLTPQNITGLEANQTYRVRIVGTKQFNSASVVSAEETFTTPELALEDVATLAPSPLRTHSARMRGTLNANNQPTSYHFEYGSDANYGSRTPDAAIGDGKLNTVARWLTDLQPDTTYHYRIVVSNPLSGTVYGNDQVFTTNTVSVPFSSGGRGYEQVSPVSKQFGNIGPVGAVARDGKGVSFCNSSGFGEPPQQLSGICAGYVSKRHDDGWKTTVPNWPRCEGGFPTANGVSAPSPDFSRYYFIRNENVDCVNSALDTAAPLPSANIYLTDLGNDPAGFDLLTPQSHLNLGTGNGFADSTDDFSRVFFTSNGQQTPDAPAGFANKIFEWRDGSISLISRDTDDDPFTTASNVASASGSVYPVSADGERVFFHNGTGVNAELYMRDGGVATHWVSQQECTPACTNNSAADAFEWATSDGSKALFMSPAKLTDDATFVSGQNNLYRYTHSADPAADQNLTLISKDDEPADGTSAGVFGASGISDDGETVFFVAAGQLVPGEPIAAGPKVYRWRSNGGSPTLEYLTTLHPSATAGGNNPESYAWKTTSSQGTISRPDDDIVTPDGKRMVLQTVMPLDPVVDQDSTLDVYLWDEGDGWTCLSCQPPGAPSAGPSNLDGVISSMPQANIGAPVSVLRQRIVMVDNGSRVFFTSHDELVPADSNGDRRDVYEWNDGALELISSGVGTTDGSAVDNVVVGASESGDDVFFITDDRLVGWDTDDSHDVYNARVGGGFPEPPAEAAKCVVGSCQGPGAGASPAPPSRTTSPAERGNADAGRRSVVTVAKPSMRRRMRASRTGNLVISVRTGKPGRLTAVATARLGKRARRVARKSLRVRKAGKVTLRLRLSPPARKRLRRGNALRLTLRVTSPGVRTRSMTVRLPGVKS
jgi:hypothetical protein